jgi:hypothetical protein
MPTLALVTLLLLPDGEQRAREFFDRIQFEAPSTDTDESRKVADILMKRETWIAAYRALEQRLGPMPDGLVVKVDFALEGGEAGSGSWNGTEGRVRFNLRQLAERLKRIEETEARRQEAERSGRRMVYRVPPVRMDRLVYHELTHVFQRGSNAPSWLLEGMAQLMGEDPNNLAAFANEHDKKVQVVDQQVMDRNDTYARGHAFWMWLDSKGAVRKAADLVVLQGRPWKEALEEATGFPWSVLSVVEREWSEREVEKLRVKDPAGR